MKYSSYFLQLFNNPTHVASLEDCRDLLKLESGRGNTDALQLFLQIDNANIIKARFRAQGSPVLIAVSEYVSAWLEGKGLHQLSDLQGQQILDALSLSTLHLPPVAMLLHLLKSDEVILITH